MAVLDLNRIPLLAIPVALMHDDFRGVDRASVERILDARLSRYDGIARDIRQELVRILGAFSHPDVWSMSATHTDAKAERGQISLIGSDMTVINARIAGRDRWEVSGSVVEALAILVEAEMKWNIPLNASGMGYEVLDTTNGIRWTILKKVQGGSVRYYVFARKVSMRTFFTLDDLARKGTISQDGARIIREHLQRDRVFVVVTGAPVSGKTTFLNAILRQFYDIHPDFYYALYGEVIDNPVPPFGCIIPPTQSFHDDIAVLLRCNASAAVIGEVSTEAAAHVVVRLLNTMSHVFTTVHAQRIPDGIGEQIASLAGNPALAGGINENLTLVVHMQAIHRQGGIRRVVSGIWVREAPGEPLRRVYRLQPAPAAPPVRTDRSGGQKTAVAEPGMKE